MSNKISGKGSIFILSAPSGCGKTTIVSKVIKGMKNVVRSVSATTRAPRTAEKKNKDYVFMSEKIFQRKAKKGEFLEWEKNFGNYYGTPKRTVMDSLSKGKDVILTIDVKGALQVKKKQPKSSLILLVPPSMNELTKRLRNRSTDSKEEIKKRLAMAKKELSYKKRYDYIVINDSIHKAASEVKSIIIAKRCEIKASK